MLHQHQTAEHESQHIRDNTPAGAAPFRAAIADYETDFAAPIPKFRIEEHGQSAEEAYLKISEDLSLDGKPMLNLASFVNTNLDSIAEKLILENLTKNLADSDEYPAMLGLHQRCISIISHLWNVPKGCRAVGCATTGSSEAIHLGGLALKRRWEAKHGKAAGEGKPNIIMGANCQVALEKFARYFDVEPRIIPVSKDYGYGFDYHLLPDYVDENTIGVFVILGSTYTGHYQDVKKVSETLDAIQEAKGWDIPIHVDAASGGFVAPFVTPELEWDFRLDRVKSINTSGHKFGLTTAGLGWILWKDHEFLPQNLVFTLQYLGGSEETYTLNFSRPGFPVIHQYHNFVRYGFTGYRQLHENSLELARLLSNFLQGTGYFDVLSEIHKPGKPPGLPVVAFKFSEDFVKKYPEIPQESMSTFLRVKGYIIPNYPLPEGESQHEVLRVVVRASLTRDLLDKLMTDILKVVDRLTKAVDQYKSATKTQTVEPIKLHELLSIMVAASADETEHEGDWQPDTEPGTSKKQHKHRHHGKMC